MVKMFYVNWLHSSHVWQPLSSQWVCLWYGEGDGAKLPACLAVCLEVFVCCLLIGNLSSATIKPSNCIALYLKDRLMKKWVIISNK